MHPPSATCRALANVHPRLRIAWHGRERADEDELNAGSFCIVQLYHIKNAGTLENPLTFWQPWDDSYGPIFAKNGSTNRDWDPLFWVPMYVANLNDYNISPREVFTGDIVDTVKSWLDASNPRARAEKRRQMNRDLRHNISDIAGGMTDYLWKTAEKNYTDPSVIVPYEDAKKDMQQVEKTLEERTEYFDHYYDTVGM